MLWRLMLILDTDEPGIVEAGKLAKQALTGYGEVRSVTVQDWQFRAAMEQPAPIPKVTHIAVPEHAQTQTIRVDGSIRQAWQ